MQNKTKKILLYLTPTLFVIIAFVLYIKVSFAAEPSVGAVNNWFTLNGATRLSVDVKANRGENGYHFYSLSPFFQDKNYGLYTGIQTNGNLGNGVDVGNIFIFSVWQGTAAYPENGSTATPFSGEGVGYSLRIPYNWVVGRTYTLTIQRQSFDSNQNGWRWSSTIKDNQTNTSIKIGEILAPAEASNLGGGSAFHERYVGNNPICSASSSNLEMASVTFSNLGGDKPAIFDSTPARNNIFASAACSPFIHAYSNSSTAITGFGMSQSEFNSLLPGANNNNQTNENNTDNTNQTKQDTSKPQNKDKKEATTNTDPSTALTETETTPETTQTNADDATYENKNGPQTNLEATSSPKDELPIGKIGIASSIILSLGLGIFALLKFHILKI